MDPLIAGYIGIGFITVLIILGTRIAFATALVGIMGIALLKGWDTAYQMAGYLPHGIVAHYSLSVIPLFIIMGYFGFHAGLTAEVFHTARQWFGHLPGGLAIATTYGCAGFAACTGSSVASAAIMGKMAIPEMLKYRYHPRLAAGAVAAGGTIATLIPPSVPLVIYGIITEQSVGLLLMAGVLPGIVSAMIYAFMIQLRCKINPSLAPALPAASWKARIVSLKSTWGIFAILIIILGGIYSGIFTPTEAGGAGATATLLMTLISGRFTWEGFKRSFLETGRATVMIFSIIVGVLIFVRFLAISGLPAAFSKAVVALPVPPIIILMGILGIFVFLGMFLDLIGMMLLALPIVFPVVVALGYDPIWFGVIVVKMGEICLITPPVGLNVFVVNSVAPEIPSQEIFLGIIPFLLMDFLTLTALIAFPQISLFLPSLMAPG
ncbi:MAG: TRAP transporter large permease [Deltaproteobacteria bacterium]|nr:TRAP transporter large permease [Deltaproteobacteria bacterium]